MYASDIAATTSTMRAFSIIVVIPMFTRAEGLQQTEDESGDKNRTARKQRMNYLHEPDLNTITIRLF